MKNIIFILLFLGFISCQKENPGELALTSAASYKKSVLVVSEERITTDDGGMNFISRNYFSNGQLVSTYGPEGPEGGIITYAYHPEARTVIAKFTDLGNPDNPYLIMTYHYDENNVIIAMDEVWWPGTTGTKSILFANGLPVKQERVFEENGQKVEEVQLYTLKGQRLETIHIIQKRPGVNGALKVKEQTLKNKGGSPFEYRMVSDDGLYSIYIRLSNKCFSPGYNIKMYPDVDLRTIHLSRNDVMRSSSIGQVVPWAWFSGGMLEMELDELSYGMRYHIWVTDLEDNKDHQPVSFHRTYQNNNNTPLVLRYFYKYERL